MSEAQLDPGALYRRGQEAWPELHLSSQRFAEHLERHASAAADPIAMGGHVEDLFLCCACVAGEARAMEIFKQRFHLDVRRVIARTVGSPSLHEEIEQKVWIRLFVATPETEPKIGRYSGRGSLRRWLQILTARVALNELGDVAGRAIETSLGDAISVAAGDPEVEYFKRHYEAEFRSAFSAAIGLLSPRDRSILNQYFVEGQSIDALALRFETHRATAARQVHRARQLLLTTLRDVLRERLHVDAHALDSILRLIESRIELGPILPAPAHP